MELLINIINRLFALLFSPFEGMRPEYALLIITASSGIVMFYLYKWTSNQDRLGKVQDRIKAHILEIQLYKNDLYIMMRALGQVFLKNFLYMRLMLLPALFLMLLVAVLVVQCYPRFEYRPIRPGEGFVFKTVLKEWDEKTAGALRLDVPRGVTVETSPMLVPSLKEVDWRLRAHSAGEYDVAVTAGAESQKMRLVVGDRLSGVSTGRGNLTLANYITNPLATPLPAVSAFSSLEVRYPERSIHSAVMLGMGWMVYYFVVSFVVALIWKFVTRAK